MPARKPLDTESIDEPAESTELERLDLLDGPCEARLRGWSWRLANGREFASQFREFFWNERLAGIRHTGPGPATLIDCGANVGTVGAWFRSQFRDSRVIAVEGDPDVLPYLRANAEEIGRTEVVSALAWTSNGETDLLSDGCCGSHKDDGRTDVGFKRQRVRTIDLRELLAQPVTLLKMDVEGAERDLIPHVALELERNVDYVHLEIHETIAQPRMLPELMTVLASCGFGVHIAPLHIDPHPFLLLESWNSIANPVAIYGWKHKLEPRTVELASASQERGST